MKEVIMDFIVELDVKNLISDSFDWNKEVDNFLKSNDKAINYTRCCKSDSEQLVCVCGRKLDWLDKSIRYCKNCFKTVDSKN